MPNARRILSLWFPHLAAERLLRQARGRVMAPFATVAQAGNALTLGSLSPLAAAQGLRPGQPLADARALCPDLLTAPENPLAEAAFLTRLRRWAGRYSPWVAEERPDALLLDITGCAHLFGGEEPLAHTMAEALCALHLTARIGLADTPGAAWALARYAGQASAAHRSGDAIEQEARATRSRAFKRRGTGLAAPPPAPAADDSAGAAVIAAPGNTRRALARLPVAALRIDHDTATNLNRLGIRIVGDLYDLPRAALARRFGAPTLRRLDQATGAEPEPVSPAGRVQHFATRLTLPDPIGLADDIVAGIDRLLPPLCARLEKAARGARSLRLTCLRADHTAQVIEVGLARPSFDPARIRPLLTLRLPDIEPGYGIDVLRLEAHVTEPLTERQHSGHAEAVAQARALRDGGDAMADLIGRLGARVGLDRLIRLHPAQSHIPEKTATTMAAAYCQPANDWTRPETPRPVLLFPPEIVTPAKPTQGRPPDRFRWRRREFDTASATGPERIAPEWWLDDPAWRLGTRDYWRLETVTGERLWLYEAKGAPGSWFCHGDFG
ncbi:MAG: DNA polymerase Y family protein [Pseudomonadota bacterium]